MPPDARCCPRWTGSTQAYQSSCLPRQGINAGSHLADPRRLLRPPMLKLPASLRIFSPPLVRVLLHAPRSVASLRLPVESFAPQALRRPPRVPPPHVALHGDHPSHLPSTHSSTVTVD
eukprot:scaffold837_cov416-Prasinococcus_capsulatus_cf.AAC.1